jgi:hypothetical protein
MEHLLLGGGILFVLFIILVVFLGSIFWIWMLIDAIISKTISDNEKILWVVVIFFTHFIGAAIYFFVGRNKRVL